MAVDRLQPIRANLTSLRLISDFILKINLGFQSQPIRARIKIKEPESHGVLFSIRKKVCLYNVYIYTPGQNLGLFLRGLFALFKFFLFFILLDMFSCSWQGFQDFFARFPKARPQLIQTI